MAKKILSFEEYSAKVTGPQIEETEMEDVVQDDVEETEDELSDEEREEVEDIVDDHEDEMHDEDGEDDDDDDEEDVEDVEESEEVEPKPVSEMMTEMYEAACQEAVAYENDDYQDHTVEGYMKENAALAATLAAKAMEEAYKEVKEGDMTVEMYEANCNSMKEAYAKKIDELKEAWGE